MPTTHKSILETANAAMARGDIDGFLAWCTDDTRWTFVGDRTLEGKDAVREYLGAAYGAPPKFDVRDMVAEGDLLTAIGEITVTGHDGKSTRSAYCDVWRFRDGKMAELRAFVVQFGDRG